MSGVIALILCHLASLRICRPVNVAATPSIELNFRRSFVALAGRAVLTAVTASPTAAERVPRPPCTTTRNVASGCAAAASSKLWGMAGPPAPRSPVAAVLADSIVNASTSVQASVSVHGRNRRFGRSIRTAVPPHATRDTGFFGTVNISILRRRRILPDQSKESQPPTQEPPHALSLEAA